MKFDFLRRQGINLVQTNLLQGTLILIFAGMITRFLGFINRLVVARLMGEEGVGLYMMAMPTLFLIMSLTQLGLPVAISKRVAEAEAKNDHAKIKKILIVSLLVTGISSIFFTIIMLVGAPYIASHLLTDKRTLLPLMAISPIVPIVAISSVLRGYFQGRQNMKPQSYSLVIEQIVRITCVAVLVKMFLPMGVEYAAAGAMFSVILGEFASLLYMVYQFKQKKTIKIRYRFFAYVKSSKNVLKELFSIALPSTGSRLIGSLSNFWSQSLLPRAWQLPA
ncbi:oligosaccharide flippase family protein [Virgibacillus sp. 179-BFC.A HS]|uniref:Oligosaccharide flippase family protein n=1 Tax=Tigheibacillus jepli TaxID=3035914 RepID=A0ABU5CIZ5_9BACI|nr:oligosaccharide flippase family protein [Virgibacillus sp. 179-BFC.A HS]MDY0405475.1 oligosaccharide flippase family protein [Virgibacillus sp. 179-BFC.A HS]